MTTYTPRLSADDSRRLGAYSQRMTWDQGGLLLRYLASTGRPEKLGDFEAMTDAQLDELMARLEAQSP